MFTIQTLSSLIENNNSILANTSRDLLNGLKISHENQWYVCGNLALNEAQFPHKLINSSPTDLDYQVLLKAAMLLVHDSVEQPLTITTGFPYATYRIYKDQAIEYLKKTHIIEYDSSTFTASGGKKTVMLDVQNVDVIPEIAGCAIALRKGETQASGSFFVLSCGFGTFESVLSMDSGIVEHTMISTLGMRYAVNVMMNELVKNYYLEFRNAHLMDEAFQKGYIILNRKNIDLKEIRKNALKTYYNEVISPNLRNVITDANLMKTNKIYLCGGAMYYQDLQDCFKAEYGDVAQLEFVSDPAQLASKGYALNSLRVSGGQKKSSIGIDIGNATTVVTPNYRMIKFVINLFNKFKKQNPQKDPVTNPKPNSKNDLISSDPILLNEPVKGNVYCSDQVIIDGAGKITGHIHSKSCVINGNVKGNILCSDSIEVKNTAIIEGNVKAGSIEIEAGSIINGFISIDKKIKLPVIYKRVEEPPPLSLPEKPAEIKFPEPELADPPVLIWKEDSITIQAKDMVQDDLQATAITPLPEPEETPIIVLKEEPASIAVQTPVEDEKSQPAVNTPVSHPLHEETSAQPATAKKKVAEQPEPPIPPKSAPSAPAEQNGNWW